MKFQPLGVGKHKRPEDGTCVMEKVSLLWSYAKGKRVYFTDLPTCTNKVVALVAQLINDDSEEEKRQHLNTMIPRLLRARRTKSDKRVAIRLCIWALGQSEEEMWPHSGRDWLRKQLQMYLEGKVINPLVEFDKEDNFFRLANSWLVRPLLRILEDNFSNAAADLIEMFLTKADNPAETLDRLLDAWEEAVTKEGEDLYVPQPWEDEALAFVAEMMACESEPEVEPS